MYYESIMTLLKLQRLACKNSEIKTNINLNKPQGHYAPMLAFFSDIKMNDFHQMIKT